MSQAALRGMRIAGVSTCVPATRVDNIALGATFGADEVRKVVAMAGVQFRHVADEKTTSADLCYEAACHLLEKLAWPRESIDAVIQVTQTPDYFLPSSACMAHKWLGLSLNCAAFDVGLGCSGYPYGLYLATTMLQGGGHRRILMLHGETPSRFVNPADHATRLLFGDAGSATALELDDSNEPCWFSLHTDGRGFDGLIIRGGAFRDRNPAAGRDRELVMDGGAIFNFTVKRVPEVIRSILEFASLRSEDIDCYLFHQSNRFIMKHIAKKCALPEDRVPLTLENFGNSGGPSVAVTLTQAMPARLTGKQRVMLLGYGVGLSWAAAIVDLQPDCALLHNTYTGQLDRL